MRIAREELERRRREDRGELEGRERTDRGEGT